jgi:two-component system, NtrC family, sensor kinase
LDCMNIHESMEGAIALIKNDLVNRGIQIEKQFGDVPEIKGNANEMTQVFTNIIINAMHAVHAAHSSDISQGRIWIKIFQADDNVYIEIKDNGCGIAQEHRNMIFDPFLRQKT